MTIRVLVVDDQRLIREGIASLLDLQDGIAVVGMAADGKEAVEQVHALGPDLVLMDVRMPELDGVAAVAVLRRTAPDCRVVMLTTFDDEEYVVQALRAGAAGYLLKDLPAAELADAVRLAHAGVTQLDEAAARHVAAALSTTNPGTRRRADRPGDRRAAAHRGRRHQPGDRGPPVPERGHGEEPHLPHPRPARPARPHPGRDLRPRPRPVLTGFPIRPEPG